MGIVVEGVRQDSSQQHRGQRRGRIGRQIGKDGAEIQEDVGDEPEPGSRQRTELAGEDRFSRVECVAADLNVVENLTHDAQGGEPHESAAVLGRDGGSHQPFASADGAPSQEQAGAQQPEPVASREDGRLHQPTGLPPRHLLGTGMGCLKTTASRVRRRVLRRRIFHS